MDYLKEINHALDYIESNLDGEIDYSTVAKLACCSIITDQEPPEGMEPFVIGESTWAVFELEGPVSKTLEDAWKRIFSEWHPASGYQYGESVDIECFPYEGNRGAEDFKFEIWLPIKKQ